MGGRGWGGGQDAREEKKPWEFPIEAPHIEARPTGVGA